MVASTVGYFLRRRSAIAKYAGTDTATVVNTPGTTVQAGSEKMLLMNVKSAFHIYRSIVETLIACLCRRSFGNADQRIVLRELTPVTLKRVPVFAKKAWMAAFAAMTGRVVD